MGLVCLRQGTVDPPIACQLCRDDLLSLFVALEEVAPDGLWGAPLGAEVQSGLQDYVDLERVFDGNLVQGAVAGGIVGLASVAVELDVLSLIS